MKFRLYTKTDCPYCQMAIRLLAEHKKEFEFQWHLIPRSDAGSPPGATRTMYETRRGFLWQSWGWGWPLRLLCRWTAVLGVVSLVSLPSSLLT